MLNLSSFSPVLRALALLVVVAIGCGAPHSGKREKDDVGSTSQAVSFQGTGDPTKVTPSLKCVTVASGHHVAVFTATNSTSSTIVIPAGPKNTLSPLAIGAAEPSVFAAGLQHFTV